MADAAQVDCSTGSAGAVVSYKKRKAKSEVWKEFEKHVVDGIVEAVCVYCNRRLSGRSTGGTSHLKRHLQVCQARPRPDPVSSPAQMNWNSQKESCSFLENLTRMVASHGRGFLVLEHDESWLFFTRFNPSLSTIERATVEDGFLAMFRQEKLRLKDMLGRSGSRVSLSGKVLDFHSVKVLCMMAHFIDQDWKIHRRRVRFVLIDIDQRDMGAFSFLLPTSFVLRTRDFEEALSDLIWETTVDWNLDHTLLAVTGVRDMFDDCSAALYDLATKLEANSAWTNCSPAEGKLWTLRCMVKLLNNLLSSHNISKVQKTICRYVMCTSRHKRSFLEFVSQLGLKRPRFEPRCLSDSYFILESALRFMNAAPRHEPTRAAGVTRPSDEELEAAERFCRLARIFHDAIEAVSGPDHSPTSNLYLHQLWKVRRALQEAALIDGYKKIFCIGAMQQQLEGYWKESYLWLSVPVVLDPRFKLGFIAYRFEQQFGPSAPEHISQVVQTVHELLASYPSDACERSSGNTPHPGSVDLEAVRVLEGDDPLHDWDQHLRARERNQVTPTSELDRYLQGVLCPRDDDFDILKWWRKNTSNYPRLARMARDVLAMPACSVAFAEEFDGSYDKGGTILPETTLSMETIEAIVCAQDWLKVTVTDQDLEDLDQTKQTERLTKDSDILDITGKGTQGTNHLPRHPEICAAETNAANDKPWNTQGSDLTAKKKRIPDQDTLLQDLCRIMPSHGHAFSILEHGGSWEFFTRLNPMFSMVSPATVETMFLTMFKQEKLKQKKLLNCSCSRVYLSARLFEYSEMRRVLCLKAHAIDQDWQIHRKTIKVCLVRPRRDARSFEDDFPELCYLINSSSYNLNEYTSNLYNIVRETIQDWSLGQTLLGITTNDLSWGNKVAQKLKDDPVGRHFSPRKHKLWISRCMAECLNGILEKHRCIGNLRYTYCQYLACSSWHRQKFTEIVPQLGLERPHVYSKFWYKDYYTLEAGLYFIKQFPDHATMCPAGRSVPSHRESKAAERFCNLARTFYDAIRVVSCADNQPSNSYFHELWKVRAALDRSARREAAEDGDRVVISGADNGPSNSYFQELWKENRTALKRAAGRDTAEYGFCDTEEMIQELDEYWKESYLWLSVPVVLDPRCKIGFIEYRFEQLFGCDHASRYASNVKAKMLELVSYYSDVDEQIRNGPSDLQAAAVDGSSCLHDWDQHVRAQARSSSQAASELERYYGHGLAPRNGEFDILSWWKANALNYPTLSRMARDVLAMPASSVSREEAFDQGWYSTCKRSVDPFEAKLSADTIEAVVCMQDWSKSTGTEAR